MITKKYIAFDIGKTKILAAVLRIGRHGYKFLDLAEFKNPHKPRKIERILLKYCFDAHKKHWTKRVAISAAHIVDSEKKTVSRGKACYGAEVFDFRFLEKNGFSIRSENDGRCFALGELFFGRGKGGQNVAALTLGTGIGGGLIVGGKNFQGAHFSAMEISHILYPHNGEYLDWENLAAGKGIEKHYYDLSRKKVSAKAVFEMAGKGDKYAREALKRTTLMLGIGVANILNVLDPEIVILGGGMSEQKKFVKDVISIARKNAYNKKANYKFAISTLKNKANLLGAASLFF